VDSQKQIISFVFYINILENYITQCYIEYMKQLMTRHFSKWAGKQKISISELANALDEIGSGQFEADLGGHILKKRIRFQGKGKSKSGRTIICYKKGDRAIFIYGFAKNEKSNLSPKEFKAFKELSKVLLKMTIKQINTAVKNGDFIEVKT